MALRNWLRSLRTSTTTRRAHPRPRLGVQQLEAREVPAVGLASAVGIGNDTGLSDAYDVATDAAGSSYMTGYFNGALDFDPARALPGDADVLTSAGGGDAFVAKYAPDGSLVWATRMGGGGEERGRSIDVDAAGNVYVTGNFNGGSAQFGAYTLTSAGTGNDGFVAKLSPAGAVQWANRWGQTGEETSANVYGDLGLAVDTDAAGNVYVLGSRMPLGSATTSPYGYDILKFKANGSVVSGWPKFINSHHGNSFLGDLVADPSGNVYATGAFSGTVDFDPAANKTKNLSGGGSSAFVLKLTSAGNFGWASSLTSAVGTTLTRDTGGNVIVGGQLWSGSHLFSQYGDRNLLLPTDLPDGYGVFVAKLNGSGGLAWAKGMAGVRSTDHYMRGLATDSAGNVYATGSFKGTIDLDPGAGTLPRTSVTHVDGSASADVFVLKLTSAGDLVWAETFGNDYNDVGYGIAVDPAGMIHLAGGYSGVVDFDPDPLDTYYLTNPIPNPNPYTQRYMFFVKLTQD